MSGLKIDLTGLKSSLTDISVTSYGVETKGCRQPVLSPSELQAQQVSLLIHSFLNLNYILMEELRPYFIEKRTFSINLPLCMHFLLFFFFSHSVFFFFAIFFYTGFSPIGV